MTPRQKEVLSLAAEGATDREIGLQLFIEECTVKTHVRTLLEFLEARNRTHAVALALREGLIE
jgi:DNA-binding NarL/FixJ family response regulator